MNKIDSIVVHCSATRAGQDIGKKEITQMHLQRGFSTIGYNFVVRLDGTVEVGRSLQIDGAHCNSKGFSGVSYNKHSIGICYVGGDLMKTERLPIPEHLSRRKHWRS